MPDPPMTKNAAYNAGLRDYGRRESLYDVLLHADVELANAYRRGWGLKEEAKTVIKDPPMDYPGKNRLNKYLRGKQ